VPVPDVLADAVSEADWSGARCMVFVCHYKLTGMPILKCSVMGAISMVVLAYASAGHAQILENAVPSWASKPAISPVPHWYEVRGGAWRVPADVVEEMAARIGAEVGLSDGARLDGYTIQYQGISSEGARSIRLMGACNTHGTSERYLSEAFYVVFDGGKCFFDAAYDPEEKRFTSLRFHAR
jgi:hypothetical protein